MNFARMSKVNKGLIGEISMALGVAIRAERLKQHISQEELAFRANVDRTYISSVERGKLNPTFNTAWEIAKGLNVPLSSLIRMAELIIETHS